MNILQIVGNNIKLHRKALGISQEELAFRCGLHRTYIGGIERGERNITIKSLYKIANALNIEVYKLIIEVHDETR